MSGTNEGYVRHTCDERGVATVEFFPPQSNSLPSAILEQLAATITAVSQDAATKVIVLRSGGNRTFCAGASFDELAAIQNETEGTHFFSGFAHVINALRRSPQLVIGRVQGKAVGGGVGLAAATDYCFATAEAAVKLSELAVGIGPFVVGPAVERKVGLSAMSQLTIKATEWKSSAWALQRGLYAEVFDSIEAMDTAIDTLAATLSQSNPAATAMLKSIFWQGTDSWDSLLLERAAISGQLVTSEFTRNAITRFKAG
ncbi:MAG: enoyl-CoA hydratase/isomerase family protein [Sphingobacteriales bacterium]|nr:enoyl-CoA hydratase/isomerase family protein [Sphingobacteriales bacterium]